MYRPDRMILGENASFSTDCNLTGLNNNLIVCGSSGCGKTMSVSEPRFLQTYQTSLIATVTKRRLVHKYKPVFEDRGFTVLDLNLADPDQSTVAYDPLQYVNSFQDISFLANSIVDADTKHSNSKIDPYWSDTAASLLSAEIAYVIMTMKNPTFADVLEFHNSIKIESSGSMIETNVDYEFDRLAAKDKNNFAYTCWKTFRSTPARTAGCIFSSLNVMLDKIFSPDLRKMISSKNPIDFKKLAGEKTVLFISTSAVNPSLQSYINMFYAQAFKSLFEFAETCPNGQLPRPVHMLCDDFATGGRIKNFPEYISIFREKLISVTLLVQSESQLASMYGPDNATTIINNCDTYIYMGGMDIRTGESVSRRLNVPLEDVLYMPIGREYIFRRGMRPIVTERYNIRENAQYKRITDAYEKSIKEASR